MKTFQTLALTAALVGLAACGSDGGSSAGSGDVPGGGNGGTPATTLTGTAAIGAPIAGTVFAIDVNGKVSPAATTSALGAFTVDVAGMTAPFILNITGTAGGKQVVLNSIAKAVGQTVNITPLTDLIVSTAAGRPAGSALAALCAPVNNVAPADCLTALNGATTKLDAAVAAVTALIAPVNTAGTNPLTGAFTADGSGMDGLLDRILVSPALNAGDMATVTLIATGTSLGSVALAATSGGDATVTPVVPTQDALTRDAAAATVLPQVNACLASLSALYPATNFTPPTTTQVEPFVDANFSMGTGIGKDQIVAALASTDDFAKAGATLHASGLSPFDMSPLSSGELASLNSSTTVVDLVKARTSGAVTFDSGNNPTSAWVHIKTSGDAVANNWKMVKGAAYAGCPGGWKLAGSGHLDMHMNSRVHRAKDGNGAVSFSREWAFHMGKDEATQENTAIDTAVIKGPGLSIYSGNASAPVGAGQALVLSKPTGLNSWYVIGSGQTFYQNGEALQSCQDLGTTAAAGTTVATGTPCIDETKVAPGKLYSWVLKSGGANGTLVLAFPFQVHAVPLSKAFAQANQASLFATVSSVSPAGAAALNTALAGVADGAALDNLFTFNYTQQATYGSRMDNCGIGLYDANGAALLVAEQNAVGHESSCTFSTGGLNAGDLSKPASAVARGYIGVTTIVLGNQASHSQPY